MGLPVLHNLNAYRGDSWSQGFRFMRADQPVDLTDATVESEARSSGGKRTPLVVEVENATDGRVRLRLPPTLKAATYQYDVEVTEAGVVTTWVKGQLALARDVTNEHV